METLVRFWMYDPLGKPIGTTPFAYSNGIIIPRRKEYVCYQYWKLEVFKIEYAYTEKYIFVDVKCVWEDEDWKSYKDYKV